MDVPANTHPEWKNILNGNKNYDFELLAIKMKIARLKLIISTDSSDSTLNQCVEELRTVMVENINLLKVQRDLEKIFG